MEGSRCDGLAVKVGGRYLPLHASWLNQVEIYFAIVQRKVLTPNDFTNPSEIEPSCWPSRPGMSKWRSPLSGSSRGMILLGL